MDTPTGTDYAVLNAKRTYFDAGHTLSYGFRKKQLQTLRFCLLEHEAQIAEALWLDLHKNATEAWYSETGLVLEELNHALKYLKHWMQPERVGSPLVIQPSVSTIHHRPKGVVLIISPWNYPLMLVFAPLIGAIAAGNCAVVKPSEEAPHTAALIERIVAKYFDPAYISVVTGAGVEVVPAMMKCFAFNHVFFTGSPAVGRSIAHMATDTHTSTTLELGGKSPGIIDADASMRVAAWRMVWGKFTNAGQTCVAPDYVLVHSTVYEAFTAQVVEAIEAIYGKDPKQSPYYGRMINMRRFEKVAAYLSDGMILHGGQTDEAERYIAPTILKPHSWDVPSMREEIFGPVWPVVTWNTKEELLEIIRRNRYPLSLYYFGKDSALKQFILDRVEFGGGCFNNTLAHLGNSHLPFGGVQGSGYGSYHGHFSFTAFSHAIAMISTTTWPDPSLRYPPYGKWKHRLFRWLLGGV